MTKPDSHGADGADRDDVVDDPQLGTDSNLVREDLNELSATRQIAYMLEHEDDVAVSGVDDSVELASENDDTSIDWGVVLPAGILVLATVIWGLVFTESFNDLPAQHSVGLSITSAGLSCCLPRFSWYS